MTSYVKQNIITISSLFNCVEPLQQYQCEDCIFKTHLITIFNNHIKKEHQRTPLCCKQLQEKKTRCFECRNCNRFRTFSKLVLLKHNLICSKKRMSDEKLSKTNTSGYYKCQYCNLRTKFQGNLSRHMKLKHTPLEDIPWYTCDQCGFQAKQKDNIKSHQIARHLPPTKIQWFSCDKCPYRGKKLSALKGHVMSVHTAYEDILWYGCANCCFKSKKKFNLQVHMQRMHGEGREKGLKKRRRRRRKM